MCLALSDLRCNTGIVMISEKNINILIKKCVHFDTHKTMPLDFRSTKEKLLDQFKYNVHEDDD